MAHETLSGLRLRCGHSQESLAEALEVSVSTVQRWEQRKTSPQPWLRRPLAAELQISVESMADLLEETSSPRPAGVDSAHSGAREHSFVDGWEEPADVWHRLRRLEQGTVGAAELELFVDQIYQLVGEYEHQGPVVLAPQAAQLRVRLQGLLDEQQRLAHRRELTRLAAQTSGVLGYMSVNAGRFRLAEAYCAEALNLAEDCDELALQQWVRGTQSLGAYYAGQYARAREYATAGRALAPQHPQAIRLLLNGQARAAGKLGEAREAHAAVEQGMELLSYHDIAPELTPCISFAPYGYARAAANAATAYVALGDVEQVLGYTGAVDSDVEHADSDWSRALVRLDVATALLQQRSPDLEQAMNLGHEALRASRHRPIRSVWQRTSTLYQHAVRWPKHPAVVEFGEALRSWQEASAVRAIAAG